LIFLNIPIIHFLACHLLQEVLSERVKAFLGWQNALTSLQKRREQRSRLELGGKLDRMGAVLEVSLRLKEQSS
jgi:hypothetical protein